MTEAGLLRRYSPTSSAPEDWNGEAERRVLLRAADEWGRRRPTEEVPAEVVLGRLADFTQAWRETLERLPDAGRALLTRLHHEAQVMVQTMPHLAHPKTLPALELLRTGRVCSDAGREQLAQVIACLEDARERGINPDSVVGACVLGREPQTPLRDGLHDGRNRDVEEVMDGVFFDLDVATLDPVRRVLFGVEELT